VKRLKDEAEEGNAEVKEILRLLQFEMVGID